MYDDGIEIFCTYMVDIIFVGSKIGIETTIRMLSTNFHAKHIGELNDHIGCIISRSRREEKVCSIKVI